MDLIGVGFSHGRGSSDGLDKAVCVPAGDKAEGEREDHHEVIPSTRSARASSSAAVMGGVLFDFVAGFAVDLDDARSPASRAGFLENTVQAMSRAPASYPAFAVTARAFLIHDDHHSPSPSTRAGTSGTMGSGGAGSGIQWVG